MRKIILLILVTLCLIACRKEKTGKINDKKSIVYKTDTACNCPESIYHKKGSVADSIFEFSNLKTIALCGYKNDDGSYSEFTLSVCNSNKVIDFWGALKSCNIKAKKDTLYIDELKSLPILKDFKYDLIVWNIEKIYFNEGNILRKKIINPDIPKYDDNQIAIILTEYEEADTTINEDKMELANRLFVAALSGSSKAKEYFYQFPEKMNLPGGAYSEEYHELEAMLKNSKS